MDLIVNTLYTPLHCMHSTKDCVLAMCMQNSAAQSTGDVWVPILPLHRTIPHAASVLWPHACRVVLTIKVLGADTTFYLCTPWFPLRISAKCSYALPKGSAKSFWQQTLLRRLLPLMTLSASSTQVCSCCCWTNCLNRGCAVHLYITCPAAHDCRVFASPLTKH